MPATGDVFYRKKTGRSRTLTMVNTGALSRYSANLIGLFPAGYVKNAAGYAKIEGPGSGPSGTRARMWAISSNNTRGIGWGALAETGFGSSDSVDNVAALTVPIGFPTPASGSNDCTFTATWTIEVEEWFEAYLMNTHVAGADGDPTYGGPAVTDIIPRAWGIRFYEVAPVGALCTAKMEVVAAAAGAVAFASDILASAVEMDYYGRCILIASATDNGFPGTSSVTANLSSQWGPGTWTGLGPETNYSGNDGFIFASVDSGSCAISATSDYAQSSVGTITNGTVDTTGEPSRKYTAAGHVYAWDQDYPQSLVMNIQGAPAWGPTSFTCNPGGGANFEQHTWVSGWVDRNGSSHSFGSAFEWEEVRLAMDSATLLLRGEDTNDWRPFGIYGKLYDAMRIKVAADLSAGTATPSGADWEIVYTPLPASYQGYRYLRVALKTDAIGETVTVTTDSDPGKTYTIETTSTSTTLYLVDLCAPDSPGPTDNPELIDSFLPLENDGLSYIDGTEFGITRVRSLTFSGGTNLDVSGVDLHRETPAIVDIAPAFLDWELIQTDDSYHADGSVGAAPIIQQSRGVTINADGKRGQIYAFGLRQLFVDAFGVPFWRYASPAVANLLGYDNTCFEDNTNGIPGYTVDHSPYVATDGLHAIDGSEGVNLITGGNLYMAGAAVFLMGGGVTCVDYTFQNQLGIEVGASFVSLQMQMKYDELILYPGAGEWNKTGGAFDVRMPICAAKIFDAPADGLIYSGVTGSKARLYDSSNILRGTGTSDAWFKYVTDSPFGKGQFDHSLRSGGITGDFTGTWDPTQNLGTDPATQNKWNARRAHRAVFRPYVKPTGYGDNWNLHTPWGHYHQLGYRVEQSLADWERSRFVVPPFEMTANITTGDDDREFRAAYVPTRSGVMVTTFSRINAPGDVCYTVTSDDGETFVEGTLLISNAIHPTIVALPDGTVIVAAFRYDSGDSGPGSIVAKQHSPKDQSMTNWSSEFAFTDGTTPLSVEDDTFHFTQGPERSARLVLVARKAGDDGPTTWFSADHGPLGTPGDITWEEI